MMRRSLLSPGIRTLATVHGYAEVPESEVAVPAE
jgi:hypothetical protein